MSTPEPITAFARDLHADLGVTPVIEALDATSWRITCASDRVELTIDYRRAGRGRFVKRTSTLSVDGERVPLRTSYRAVVVLFRDPSSVYRTLRNDEEIDESTYPLPYADPATAPEVIRKVYRKTRLVLREGMSLHLGNEGRRWTLTITVSIEPDVTIRRHWMVLINPHNLKPEVRQRTVGAMQFFVDGTDVTDEFQGRMDALMARYTKQVIPNDDRGNTAAPALSSRAPSTAQDARKGTIARI